jgi:peptide-methionine (R)-S-oxide reductase
MKTLACFAMSVLLGSCGSQPQPIPEPAPAPITPATSSPMTKYNALNPEEARVILRKGTERAFTGEYTDNKADGTYICRQCNAPLYLSKDKFHSGCGWPSFYDQSSAKNIRELVDNSGGMHRIETVCKRCDAHLGHVFEGEGYKTPTDRRFCINGVALKFVPKGGKAPELEAIASEAVQKKKADVAKEGGVEVRK